MPRRCAHKAQGARRPRRAVRLPAIVLLALLLAGCAGGGRTDQPEGGDGLIAEVPDLQAYDRLTGKLAPDSGQFQDFAHVEDTIAVGGGEVAFVTGLGMHCNGDADGAAPANRTGVVACAVRLKTQPDAEAQTVHALGLGDDLSRLTPRLAAEPVEWRVQVVVADNPSPGLVFDSGWRTVDLSPGLLGAAVDVETVKPCDAPNAVEEADARRGEARLNLTFRVKHAQANVTIDVGPSIPTKADPGAELSQTFSEHGYEGGYGMVGPEMGFRTVLVVDLEAESPPGQPSPFGPCSPAPTLGSELQAWSAVLSIRDAAGNVQTFLLTADVLVYLGAA